MGMETCTVSGPAHWSDRNSMRDGVGYHVHSQVVVVQLQLELVNIETLAVEVDKIILCELLSTLDLAILQWPQYPASKHRQQAGVECTKCCTYLS